MNEPSYFPAREEPAAEGDELLADLEESIPQGVPNATNYGRRASDTLDLDQDLMGLDQLLQASVSAAEAEAQYKRDRELRRKGYAGLSKEEVDFCNSRMHAFEMAREWDVEAAYAVFVQVVCTRCDTARMIFSRLMEKHQHRRVRTTKRWLAVAETKAEIQTALEHREVPMCMDCMGEFGLDEVGEDTPWLAELINPEDLEAE